MIEGPFPSCPAEGVERWPASAAPFDNARELRSPAPARRRVLVVEDNPDTRDMLKALLTLWGHEVRVASTGPQGVQVASGFLPDVAVIDVGLPELDGYEVARRIRRDLGTRIRLIALTAYGQPGHRRRSLAAGFDLHLVKPCPSEELKRAILSPASLRPVL